MVDEYRAIPEDQRGEWIKAQIGEYVSDPATIERFKSAVVWSGTKLMTYAASPEDRKEISNLMWGASVAFNSLATGENITPEKMAATLKAFGNTNSETYAQFSAEVNLAWSYVYAKLKFLNQPSLTKNYLVALSEAAQTVASLYKE